MLVGVAITGILGLSDVYNRLCTFYICVVLRGVTLYALYSISQIFALTYFYMIKVRLRLHLTQCLSDITSFTNLALVFSK
ncbi:hypothetical protein GDO81_011737 [Engystomops pustulosus]|uniref:Uncharacterized protein n=1 Tax=Engystomops pustulosus TaxID=76066 RepID=A0AAV7BGY0_ENGPU|nr:hypothetical protein GDO81_011737 [Engystomops pustulosus]